MEQPPKRISRRGEATIRGIRFSFRSRISSFPLEHRKLFGSTLPPSPRRKYPLTLEPIPGCILASMGENNKPLRPSELARLAEVSSDTLRHYERLGILPKAPRPAAGYRIYPPTPPPPPNLIPH